MNCYKPEQEVKYVFVYPRKYLFQVRLFEVQLTIFMFPSGFSSAFILLWCIQVNQQKANWFRYVCSKRVHFIVIESIYSLRFPFLFELISSCICWHIFSFSSFELPEYSTLTSSLGLSKRVLFQTYCEQHFFSLLLLCFFLFGYYFEPLIHPRLGFSLLFFWRFLFPSERRKHFQ